MSSRMIWKQSNKELAMSEHDSASRAAAKRMRGALFAAAVLTSVLVYAAVPTYPTVTSERLINAQQDSGWLMYRRNYESTGYAPFDQINGGNVGKLTIAFNHQSGLSQGHEAAPVEIGR